MNARLNLANVLMKVLHPNGGWACLRRMKEKQREEVTKRLISRFRGKFFAEHDLEDIVRDAVHDVLLDEKKFPFVREKLLNYRIGFVLIRRAKNRQSERDRTISLDDNGVDEDAAPRFRLARPQRSMTASVDNMEIAAAIDDYATTICRGDEGFILRSRLFGEMTFGEIGAVVDMSATGVRNSYLASLARLRGYLQARFPDYEPSLDEFYQFPMYE